MPAHRPSAWVETIVVEKALPGPIDFAHLGRFTLGNRALELEVLDLFSSQAPQILARLQAADTLRAWVEATHTLKGSARAVGAHTVARLAEHAERLGLPDPTAKAALVASLTEAVSDVVRHVASLERAA
jgi:HPt (histidine-containing phosphotransfer) domain-containing protein